MHTEVDTTTDAPSAAALAPVETLRPDAQERLRALYEAGFPPHERAAWDDLVRDRRPTEEALALVSGGEPLAFVHVRSLAPTDRVFLRYLVVREDLRGRGVGGTAWEHLLQHCVRLDAGLLVWDVEHPDAPGLTDDEVALRRRRITFYERLGGHVLPVDGYTNPDVGEDGRPGVEHPMLLMATGLGDASLPLEDRTWVDGVLADVQRYRWGR